MFLAPRMAFFCASVRFSLRMPGASFGVKKDLKSEAPCWKIGRAHV